MATTKSTKRHMSKAERQQARERAQERAQAALDRLGEGVREVYQSERWESWLRSLSKFHDYSLGNTILIAMQMPTATHVASFRSWKRDFNRYVKRGERGIEILVPMLVKDRDEDADEDRRRLVGFRVGHVFDVSQTDGEPLPTLVDEVAGGVERYAAVMEAVRAVSAYPVELVAARRRPRGHARPRHARGAGRERGLRRERRAGAGRLGLLLRLRRQLGRGQDRRGDARVPAGRARCRQGDGGGPAGGHGGIAESTPQGHRRLPRRAPKRTLRPGSDRARDALPRRPGTPNPGPQHDRIVMPKGRHRVTPPSHAVALGMTNLSREGLATSPEGPL